MASEAGYSGTPLVKKLGLKSGFSIYILNAPEHYWDLISPIPEDITTPNPGNHNLDFVHYFEKEYGKLMDTFNHFKDAVKRDGMVWISWPKGSSSLSTDLNGNIIRAEILKTEFVDTKVCAVDSDWSGLKFMVRKELR